MNLAVVNFIRRLNQFFRFCLKTMVSLVKKAKRIPAIFPKAVAHNSCWQRQKIVIRTMIETRVVASPKNK